MMNSGATYSLSGLKSAYFLFFLMTEFPIESPNDSFRILLPRIRKFFDFLKVKKKFAANFHKTSTQA